jgi:hypothetical protein
MIDLRSKTTIITGESLAMVIPPGKSARLRFCSKMRLEQTKPIQSELPDRFRQPRQFVHNDERETANSSVA